MNESRCPGPFFYSFGMYNICSVCCFIWVYLQLYFKFAPYYFILIFIFTPESFCCKIILI